jgi:Putative Ig domain
MPELRRQLTLLSLFVLFCHVLSTSSAAQTPLRLKAVTPCRLVDTRSGQPILGGTAQIFNLPNLSQSGGAGGACTPFDLSSALAYSLNVTLVSGGTRVRYLTIWPTGEPQPLVSLMNSFDGRTKANAAILPAGNAGNVSVYVSDTTNVLIDINAYFASAADGSALAFFPLPPCRIVDTRNSGGPIPGHQEHDFSIPGNCGIPSDAQAYSFNITALPSGPVGYVSVWPAGESQPTVSTLNDYTGTNVANAAIVPAGSENKTAVYPSATTNLLIDTNGYFAPASSAASPLSLYTITPCRVVDTRQTIGSFNGTIPIGIVGSLCGVPNVAQAFTLNATVLPSGALGFLTLWPEGSTQPGVSTLNAADGAVTSNMAIVPAGSGNESINAFASGSNPTQLLLDVASYFAPVANLGVLTSSLPDGTLNSGYTVQLVAVGGVSPYAWTKTSGNLPPGLNLSSAGLIEGTATATGNYSFSVKATDSNSPAATATANLQITVNGSAGTLAITTSSLSSGTINTPYNALLSANGGISPYSWTIASGTLPTGLSLDPHFGLISGTPGAAGITSVTIKVTDVQNDTATQTLMLTINTGDANGTLNGNYAVTFQGFDQSNAFAAMAAFTADGNGHITAGETDSNSHSGVKHATITSGTYSVGTNGLGQINWTDSSGGNVSLLISTGAAEDMRVIAFNQNGSSGTWGAGVMRQQNPSDFNEPALAGNWVFGLQGFDSSGNPFSADGTYNESASGVFTDGAEDVNDFGTHSQLSFTGSVSGSADSNGRATTQIHIGSSTINYAAYIVSANEVLLVDIDSGGLFTITDAIRQSGTMNDGILNGNGVGFGSRIHNAGQGNANSQAIVLLINSDGNGNMGISIDANTGGTYSQSQEDGTYSVAANGRTALNLPGGAVIICYMVAANQGFCINAIPGTGEVKGAEVLYFEPQSGGPFSDSSYLGEYLGGSLPQYLSGNLSQIDSSLSSGDGTYSSTYSQSGPTGTNQNQMILGSYSVDSTGAITITSNGNPLYAGYLVSGTKLDLVTSGSGSAPLALVESTSSAPRHH